MDCQNTNNTKQIIWAGTTIVSTDIKPKSNFGVCVEGNRIIATGTRDELQFCYPNARVVGSEQFLLTPAFVNSHDHGRGLGTASLGVPDNLLEIWLLQLSSLPNIDPYLAAACDGLHLLRSGVGTVAHSHNPRSWKNMEGETAATIRGYRDAGIRVAFSPPIVDQNPLVYDDRDRLFAILPNDLQSTARELMTPVPLDRKDYFGLCTDLLSKYHDTKQFTSHIQVSPAGGQWCSDELILEAVDFACRHNTKVQMHLLETRYQQQYAYRKWGKSFVRHLEEIGALGEWLTCAHMVWVDETDLYLLAEKGVGIAHNPSSNLRLRSGIAPTAKMLAAGVNVGIGLDGHSLEDDQDFLREMRLAWTLGNQPGASSPSITAQTIWQMGTTTGVAITLRKDVPLGQLAVGYLADLVVIDCSAFLPTFYWDNLPKIEVVLRQATYRQVKHVMVNGRWVVWNAQSQTLDVRAIVKAIQEELALQQNQEFSTTRSTTAWALSNYLRDFYATWD
ncbi:amidohydrolase family protein [Scytonema sp. UIC 10036]|uniref:amidohydrolase family protein n=1 Tax=Scytonema sp. UIC 10036 TaxID=2304196 RepID=UPI0012DA5013|nr:amidohydrolase family protein [Scytonema sp. UIC 10036]MUG95978.1 amidohydrolase family protein [Scytonema sp. UIC 10036]